MAEQRERIAAACLIGGVAVVVVIASIMAPAPSRGSAMPELDSEELTRVPIRAANAHKQPALRSAASEDLALTLQASQSEIELSRASGDPRPLGRAQGLLEPWLSRPQPPARVLLLAATIAQSLHRFDEALELLERAIAADPNDPQSWLTRASVLTVRGRYEEAHGSCQGLTGLASAVVLQACVAQVDAVTGQARAARSKLERMLAISRDEGERNWLRSLHAELVYWTGDKVEARRELSQVLAQTPGDRYSRGLYADLLLDEGRADEVLTLLVGQEEDDAMLLRLALAGVQLERSDAARWIKLLRDRFDEARLRGDFVHQREEGRLFLALPGEVEAALRSARENFVIQKEPWDARLLLEASLRAGHLAAARPALDWLRKTGFESPTLQQLAAKLGSTP